MSILTFKLKHDKDVRLLLRLAFDVAVFTVKNKIKSPNTTFVKDVRSDLPSAIACQVMRKYRFEREEELATGMEKV